MKRTAFKLWSRAPHPSDARYFYSPEKQAAHQASASPTMIYLNDMQ